MLRIEIVSPLALNAVNAIRQFYCSRMHGIAYAYFDKPTRCVVRKIANNHAAFMPVRKCDLTHRRAACKDLCCECREIKGRRKKTLIERDKVSGNVK